MPAVSEPRIIKKYPNRRLYDTTVSSYITLEDVRKLVLDSEEFCVIDARSKDDITRSILLQIILEQEEDGNPIFSEQVLAQVIRFYGDALQGTLTNYLDRSFGLFVEQQESMHAQMQSMVTTDPISFMRGVAEKNMSMWKDMQDSFINATAAGGGFAKDSSDSKKS
ncbi:MAG: polyhydroxyalkanoate synthesis repressor PhaR [Gammaproteobacteria bacterium]